MSDLLHEYQNLYYQAMALTALCGALTCALIACAAFLFRKPKNEEPIDWPRLRMYVPERMPKWTREKRSEGNE